MARKIPFEEKQRRIAAAAETRKKNERRRKRDELSQPEKERVSDTLSKTEKSLKINHLRLRLADTKEKLADVQEELASLKTSPDMWSAESQAVYVILWHEDDITDLPTFVEHLTEAEAEYTWCRFPGLERAGNQMLRTWIEDFCIGRGDSPALPEYVEGRSVSKKLSDYKPLTTSLINDVLLKMEGKN